MTTPFQPFVAASPPYFTDRYSYLTDIQTAEDGTEQRMQVRAVPKRECVVPVRTISVVDVQRVMASLYGGQATTFNVPLWPRGTYSLTAVTAGSGRTFTINSTTGRIANGTKVFLGHSTAGPEVVTASSVSGTTFVATTAFNWPSGTVVIPTETGSLSDVSIDWLGPQAAASAVPFTLTGQTDPGVTTVTEAEIFDVVPYIRRDVTHGFERTVDRLEFPATGFTDYARRGSPIGTRPFKVWLTSRASVDALLAWFHGLKGRLAPFWLPTYHPDISVVSGLGTDTLLIRDSLYTPFMFPQPSRRHLAFITPAGVITHRVVTASEQTSLGIETLTLDDAAPSGPVMVSYLLYGRLASDTLEIRWRTQTFADCELVMQELPQEAEALV